MHFLCHKIEYGDDKKKEIIKRLNPFLKDITNEFKKAKLSKEQEDKLKGLVRSVLNPLMYTFKNKSYSSEKEWRLICQIPNNSDLYNKRVKFDEREIPQLYIETDPIIFKSNDKEKLKIIIGPKVHRKDLIKHYLEYLLAKRGFNNVEVKYSKIKYRD
ncbi:DUF2971 domain-containing protein [Lentisphaerota bacterium WC36G]|nr:hypothetical protein LJT99_10225 [Lentisphaerae bacterium WC36]